MNKLVENVSMKFMGVNLSTMTSKDIVIVFKGVFEKFEFGEGYVDTTPLQLESLLRFMSDLGYEPVDESKLYLGFEKMVTVYDSTIIPFNDSISLYNNTRAFFRHNSYTVNGKPYNGNTYFLANGESVDFKTTDLINAYENKILSVVSLQYQKQRKGKEKGYKVTKPQVRFQEEVFQTWMVASWRESLKASELRSPAEDLIYLTAAPV